MIISEIILLKFESGSASSNLTFEGKGILRGNRRGLPLKLNYVS